MAAAAASLSTPNPRTDAESTHSARSNVSTVPSLIGYLFHFNCSNCHHRHKAKLIELSSDPSEKLRIRCDKCSKNAFGTGRHSTQNSLVSQATHTESELVELGRRSFGTTFLELEGSTSSGRESGVQSRADHSSIGLGIRTQPEEPTTQALEAMSSNNNEHNGTADASPRARTKLHRPRIKLKVWKDTLRRLKDLELAKFLPRKQKPINGVSPDLTHSIKASPSKSPSAFLQRPNSKDEKAISELRENAGVFVEHVGSPLSGEALPALAPTLAPRIGPPPARTSDGSLTPRGPEGPSATNEYRLRKSLQAYKKKKELYGSDCHCAGCNCDSNQGNASVRPEPANSSPATARRDETIGGESGQHDVRDVEEGSNRNSMNTIRHWIELIPGIGHQFISHPQSPTSTSHSQSTSDDRSVGSVTTACETTPSNIGVPRTRSLPVSLTPFFRYVDERRPHLSSFFSDRLADIARRDSVQTQSSSMGYSRSSTNSQSISSTQVLHGSQLQFQALVGAQYSSAPPPPHIDPPTHFQDQTQAQQPISSDPSSPSPLHVPGSSSSHQRRPSAQSTASNFLLRPQRQSGGGSQPRERSPLRSSTTAEDLTTVNLTAEMGGQFEERQSRSPSQGRREVTPMPSRGDIQIDIEGEGDDDAAVGVDGRDWASQNGGEERRDEEVELDDDDDDDDNTRGRSVDGTSRVEG